ncbi:MAG: FtsX-like permease family protein [Rikenellaceae bacterium]
MRSLSLKFSLRYLFSKKSHSVINIISLVSCVAVGVPVAGMIILLSIFNGFEDLVKQMYNNFDPDVLIESNEAKFFDKNKIDFSQLENFKGVESYATYLEDNALVEYRGKQTVVTIRGVDSLYHRVVPIEDMVVSGEYKLELGFLPQALVGQGVAYNLGLNPRLYNKLTVYSVANNAFSSMLGESGFKSEIISPSGIFLLDADTDGRYVLVPLSFAQEVFSSSGKLSSVIIKTSKGFDIAKLKALLGDDFRVLTRYEQKSELYRIMTYEKWGIFFIIMMVMLIASFSIIGSITMLVIDKKNDTLTLRALGAHENMIRRIFIGEGVLISAFGAVIGLVIGLGFCFLQQSLGFIKIPAETFLIESYPVIVSFVDVILVVAVFFAINYIITFASVRLYFRTKNSKKR